MNQLWVGSDDYERYVGRWSRPVADAFLAWLDVAPDARWIDVGCGTGALTERILKTCLPADVLGLDPSADFLSAASARLSGDRARFQVARADALPAADESVDAAVSGLVMNFVPDADAAVREAARVTRRGGLVAGYVWDYASGMELIRRFWDAAIALDPSAREKDEAVRSPIARPAPLAAVWDGAGLADVEVRPIDVPTVFRDFDDYWGPFLSNVAPAPRYAVSLPSAAQVELRERLRSTLPVGPGGSIRLTARAWAVRGYRSKRRLRS